MTDSGLILRASGSREMWPRQTDLEKLGPLNPGESSNEGIVQILRRRCCPRGGRPAMPWSPFRRPRLFAQKIRRLQMTAPPLAPPSLARSCAPLFARGREEGGGREGATLSQTCRPIGFGRPRTEGMDLTLRVSHSRYGLFWGRRAWTALETSARIQNSNLI